VDASNDIKSLFGVTCDRATLDVLLAFTATEVFEPHQTDELPTSGTPRHDLHDAFLSEPRTQPVSTISNQTILDGEQPCASEFFEAPQWLVQEYVPQYEHELPSYIKVPDKAISTWE